MMVSNTEVQMNHWYTSGQVGYESTHDLPAKDFDSGKKPGRDEALVTVKDTYSNLDFFVFL